MKMENIKYSILIVTLNAGRALQKTIQSIERQNYQNYEVIVKDGCSDDDTFLYIPSDKRYRLIKNKDLNVYDGMNQAIELIDGDFTIFMNAGDRFYNESVLFQVDQFVSKNKLAGVCVLYGDYSRAGTYIKKQETCLSDFILYRHSLCHQSIFYSSELFKSGLRYDISFKICADHELTLRLWTKHVPFYHTGMVICDYEGEGLSESKSGMEDAVKEKDLIIRRYFSPKKRLYLRSLYFFTFPNLRKFLISKSSPAFIRNSYKKIRNFLTK